MLSSGEYYGSAEQEFWEKPKPSKPTPDCKYCAPVYPNMRVKWPTGEITRHLVKHYHWSTGRIVLEQKPIEGSSQWCQHTYPLYITCVHDTTCKLTFGNMRIEVIAGDQEF